MSGDDTVQFLKRFRWLFAITVFVVAFGTYFYHVTEGWSWVNAYYFSVVSLTTVGYGDITPVTDAGKLFTTVYLVIGIGIIAAFVNNLLKHAMVKRELRQEKRKK